VVAAPPITVCSIHGARACREIGVAAVSGTDRVNSRGECRRYEVGLLTDDRHGSAKIAAVDEELDRTGGNEWITALSYLNNRCDVYLLPHYRGIDRAREKSELSAARIHRLDDRCRSAGRIVCVAAVRRRDRVHPGRR